MPATSPGCIGSWRRKGPEPALVGYSVYPIEAGSIQEGDVARILCGALLIALYAFLNFLFPRVR